MHIDRTRCLAAFQAYVSAYDPTNPRISLKVDHTVRVADLCERIAGSLGLAQKDINLAWLCGLLHDIGRFEQVRRWETFNDAASARHAELGVETLFEARVEDADALGLLEANPSAGCTVLRHFVDDATEDALIRTAIATHSDFRLPADLDPRTRMFCDILRDADKVDILHAACTCDREAIFGVGEAALRESGVSPAVRDAFYAHRTVRRDERKQPADLVLSFVCFAFELVHNESVRAVVEQGHLFELLDVSFEQPETQATVAAMRGHLDLWLKDRLIADKR